MPHRPSSLANISSNSGIDNSGLLMLRYIDLSIEMVFQDNRNLFYLLYTRSPPGASLV